MHNETFKNQREMKQTAVEWLISKLQKTRDWQRVINEANESSTSVRDVIAEAKEMEKEQSGYTEEQAYKIWKAGQEYWKTSGASITYEELIETFKTNER